MASSDQKNQKIQKDLKINCPKCQRTRFIPDNQAEPVCFKCDNQTWRKLVVIDPTISVNMMRYYICVKCSNCGETRYIPDSMYGKPKPTCRECDTDRWYLALETPPNQT